MIEYKLRIYNGDKLVSNDYLSSLPEGLFLIAKKLNNVNLLDMLKQGEFPETYFDITNTYHHKRFKVECEPLNMTLEIFKQSGGDINQELVENIIKEIFKAYERDNDKSSK